MAFTSNAVSVALPSIASYFHISNILQNWIVTIFLLTIAATSVPFGKICGKYGLKKTTIIGLIIYVIGSFLSGAAINSDFLLLSRVIQGIGASILFVTGMAIITTEIPPEKRGQAIGLNVSGVYIGLTLAPTLGGILVYNFDWRSIFYIMIPIAIIALLILYFKIDKEWKIDSNINIDKQGSVLYMIGIILLLYGFSILNTITGLILTIVGLIILILFGKFELNLTNPIYNIRLFKSKVYTSANIASLISYLATFVVTYILNYYFQYIQGLNSQTTGIILIVTPLLMAIMAPFAGKLSDKMNAQLLSAIGMGFVTIAMLILCFLSKTTPLYWIIIAMILQGIGYGLFSSPNNNTIMSSVDKKEAGTASASLSTVRTLGQTFSLGMLTVIFAFIMGNVMIQPSNYNLLLQSCQMSMIISTILGVFAVILSLIGTKSSYNKNS